MTPQEFATKLDDAVKAQLPQLQRPSQLLIVSHGAFESGWGKANAFRRGFNFANITAGRAWLGAKWTDVGGDTDAAGKKITQVWRAYKSLADAVTDYWDFLGPQQNTGRYAKARLELEQNANPSTFAALLHKAGYFELNPLLYAQRLGAVHKAVQQYLMH